VIEADGLVLAPVGKMAARRGEPEPPKPFAVFMDTEGYGLIRYYMTPDELYEFALGTLRMICNN
jgi:hypothetical protein